MTVRRGFGAAVLAIGVMTSIASMLVRLPREMHSLQALRWSKLGASRLASGQRTNDTRMLFEALGAADHALRIEPGFVEARLQRAAVLARLRLSHYRPSYDYRAQMQAPQTRREYAEGELLWKWVYAMSVGRSESAARELTKAREIGQSLLLRSGEALVADGVAAIDDALRTNDRRRVARLARAHELLAAHLRDGWRDQERLIARLDEATLLFRRAESPMQWLTRYERAFIDCRLTPAQGCARSLQLFEDVPVRYRALRGQLYRLRARCLAKAGRYDEASRALMRAIELFDELGEHWNALLARVEYGFLLARIGDRHESWQWSGAIVARAAAMHEDYFVHGELNEIAQHALREQEWDIARSVASLAIETSASHEHRVTPRLLRAVAAWNQGDVEAAKHDLRQARLATTSPNDDTQKFALQPIEATELALTPHSLAKSLSHAIETRPSTVAAAADALSATYLGLSSDIYTELVDLLDARGQTADAFAVSERGRGRMLLDRMGYEQNTPLTVDDVRRALSPRTLVVSFVPLRDRLVIFTIDREHANVAHVRITRQELSARIDVLNEVIRTGTGWRTAAAMMHDALFGSLGQSIADYDTLVIVPDALLERVPFAALVDPATQRLLIESTAPVIAPSASVYVSLSGMRETARATALVVADSDVAKMAPLPSARAEAREIASLYRASALVGDDARPDAFLARMDTCDVLHVGAHTFLSNADPMRSSILMTRGEIRVRDLVRRKVRRGSIAVLAGCQTATRTGDSDVNSLALAFLAAGSRASVASLWRVEDSDTRRFSVRLHRLLRSGIPVSQAVRRAQLDMRAKDVRSWAAFQVYGGG
jgi:CHAT domain-containing protein